jgi:hypothetical protein
MDMVDHQDVAVELSTRLLAAQREIESLHTQPRNSDATIRGYKRMVEGQACDLYASDTEPCLPAPQSRVQPRSLQLIATPPPDPFLARSYPKLCQESLACVMF